MISALKTWVFGCVTAALMLTANGVMAQTGPTIAAASDLKFALDEIAATFQSQTGKSVHVIYTRILRNRCQKNALLKHITGFFYHHYTVPVY